METVIQPPGPKYIPLISTVRNVLMALFFAEPLDFFLGLARDYGDVCKFRMFGRPAVLLNRPDYVQEVLVEHSRLFVKSSFYDRLKMVLGTGLLTSEGEFHKRQRRLVQPAFHRKRIAAYGEVMTESGLRMMEGWQEGQPFDVAHEMMQLTLAIIGRTMFDTDAQKAAEQIGAAVTTLNSFMTNPLLGLAPQFFMKLPLPTLRRARNASAVLNSTVYRIIEEHRNSGRDSGDLLSMLLLAHDDEQADQGDGSAPAPDRSDSGMTNPQIRDEVMTIFLAGHETTANALAWTWYLLSKNPSAEAKLHSELDSVLEGRIPVVDDLPHLVYTQMVLAESLRLYPPAWLIGREALSDYHVGRYVVPAGQDVLMSPYVMHHDARYFADPFAFKPERWTPEFSASLPDFAYFPFGGGPRLCIGESFAKMEAALLIATIAQRWRLRVLPDHPVEPMPLVTLRPRYGVRVTPERRRPKATTFEAAASFN